METRPTLTLDVFLSTITIFFLIVSQLSLLVCLILTYVTIIPIIIRQFRAMLRINRGFILIKESACEVGRGLIQSKETEEKEGTCTEGRSESKQVKPSHFQDNAYNKRYILWRLFKKKEIRTKTENNFYLRISLLC